MCLGITGGASTASGTVGKGWPLHYSVYLLISLECVIVKRSLNKTKQRPKVIEELRLVDTEGEERRGRFLKENRNRRKIQVL